MLRQKYLSILNVICMIHTCKLQDLKTCVTPIHDNEGVPLAAIVNTTNISSHIVRSIEKKPLREIINATIECKINEKLKEDIVSTKVLGNVNNKFDSLQQKMDKHIGHKQNQVTVVILDIATLRKEMEILKNLAKTVSNENKNIDEKLEGLNAIVNDMNLSCPFSMCCVSCYYQSTNNYKIPEHHYKRRNHKSTSNLI